MCDIEYRWHRYIEKYSVENNVIMFNLLNKSIISLNSKILNDERILYPGYHHSEIMKHLINNSFLIPKIYSDKKLLKTWYKNVCMKTNSFEWLIVLTTECNFSCKYCFQELDNLFRANKDENWKTNINWFISAIKYKKPEFVKVVFFGGEPLLKFNLLLSIASKLKSTCEENNIIWEFDIVSNGYLLTESMYSTLIKKGLKRIQITLDGPPQIHNYRRSIKNSKIKTFNTVLNNLLLLKHFPSITGLVRINLDNHNYKSFSSLLDILDKNELSQFVMLSIINTKNYQSRITKWSDFCFTKKEIIEKIISCLNFAVDRGYRIYQRSLESGPCMALSKGGFIIEPNGDIGKCHHFSTLSGFTISNTREPISASLISNMMQSPWENCIDCKYVPICLGGCRYEAYKKTDNILGKSCKINLLKEMIPLYIKQYIPGELKDAQTK